MAAVMVPDIDPKGLAKIYHDDVEETWNGEQIAWEDLKKDLPDGCICYYQASIRHRLDFCLLYKDWGFVVIEFKGWYATWITEVIDDEDADEIRIKLNYHNKLKYVKSPLGQAKGYVKELREKIKDIPITPIVCYSFISEADYESKGLGVCSTPDQTIFKEDIENADKLINKIKKCVVKNANKKNTDDAILWKNWQKLNNTHKQSKCANCRKFFEPYYDCKVITTEGTWCKDNYSYISADDTVKNETKGLLTKTLVDDYIDDYVYKEQKSLVLLRKNFGFAIIEIKDWKKENIVEVLNEHKIVLNDGRIDLSPLYQAEYYMNKFREDKLVNIDHVYVFSLVCYPYLRKKDYRDKRLDVISAPYQTIFIEDLESPEELNKKLEELKRKTENYSKYGYDRCCGMNYIQCRKVVDPGYEYIPKNKVEGDYSRLSVFAMDMDEFTKAEAEKIVNEWGNYGTREIVLLKFHEHMKLLKCVLKKKLSSKGIKPEGMENLSYGDFEGFDEKPISIFRFQAIVVQDNIFTESFTVYNYNGKQLGELTEERIKQLEKVGAAFNLNQYLVEHAPIDKDICVRAGAGTGKTYSMISRVAFICHPNGANVMNPVDEIALLTFTRAAAQQMKQKLKKMFNNMFILTGNAVYLSRIEDVENMRISTIHNFARNIMKNTATVLGVGSDFSSKSSYNELKYILPHYIDGYTDLFLKNLPDEIPFYKWMKDLQQFVSECSKKSISILDSIEKKAFGEPPEELKNVMTVEVLEALGNAQKEYDNSFLKKNNSVNFDQRMENMKVCIDSPYFNKHFYPYRYLFIDEFQDTDDCQIECFLELQKKVKFNFFIVGDLKQSIYYFRGASTAAFKSIRVGDNTKWDNLYSLNVNYRTEDKLIEQFEPIFKVMATNINYEDSDQLVGIANTKNAGSFDIGYYENKIVDKNGNERYLSGGNHSWQNLLPKLNKKLDSAIDTLFKVINDTSNVDKDARTIAILVRTNSQIKKIVEHEKFKELINEKDVILDIALDDEAYKNEALKDILILLGALTHPYDTSYLFALLTQTNIVQTDNIQILHFVQKAKNEIKDFIEKEISNYFKKRMDLTWKQLLQKVQEESILKIIHDVYTKTRPWTVYTEHANRRKEYNDNFARLMEELEQNSGNTTITLNSLYDKLLIKMRKNGKDNSIRAEHTGDSKIHIVCTTVHQAKGLQYHTVILPCTNDKPKKEVNAMLGKDVVDVKQCTDGGIAYKINKYKNNIMEKYENKERPEYINEGARILYVAMTRAMRRLIVLRPNDESIKKAKDNNQYKDTWTYYLKEGGK